MSYNIVLKKNFCWRIFNSNFISVSLRLAFRQTKSICCSQVKFLSIVMPKCFCALTDSVLCSFIVTEMPSLADDICFEPTRMHVFHIRETFNINLLKAHYSTSHVDRDTKTQDCDTHDCLTWNKTIGYGSFNWAPSSEFVSSSIPSWQILTAHAQSFRGARDLAFCLKVSLESLLVWASSGGSGETARMRRLAWTFAARICYKYQIRLTRSNYAFLSTLCAIIGHFASFEGWPYDHSNAVCFVG